MLFTFKRDDEGRERIYVGDVCVATHAYADKFMIHEWDRHDYVQGVDDDIIWDAIERADDAGFWCRCGGCDLEPGEVTVDVHVADNTVLSVTTDGEDFDDHLRRSTEVVSTWPTWKRGILGGGS